MRGRAGRPGGGPDEEKGQGTGSGNKKVREGTHGEFGKAEKLSSKHAMEEGRAMAGGGGGGVAIGSDMLKELKGLGERDRFWESEV